MKRLHWLLSFLLAFLLGASPLSAQTVYQAPSQKVDEAHAKVRDALVALRDTLTLVDAAVARMQRDLAASSDAVVLARGRTLQDRCHRAALTVIGTQSTATAAGLPSPDPKKRLVQMRVALDSLHTALTKCESEFDAMSVPAKAEELRGYGVSRAQKAQSAVRRYENALQSYLGAIGVRLPPPKAAGRRVSG